MPVVITPTRSKGSLYLLIPKNIAALLEIDEHTRLKLRVKDGRKRTLEFVEIK